VLAEASGFSRVTYTQLFLFPSMIAIVIAASRTYRDLTTYATTATPITSYDILPILHVHCSLTVHSPSLPSGPSGSKSSSLAKTNRLVSSNTKNAAAVINIPSNQLEVTVHKAYEEYPMSHINSYPSSAEVQLAEKPRHDFVVDVHVERRDEEE
jgi:hypothetical protein